MAVLTDERRDGPEEAAMRVYEYTNGKGAERVGWSGTVAEAYASEQLRGVTVSLTFSPEQAAALGLTSASAGKPAGRPAREAQGHLAPKRTSVTARPAASPQDEARPPVARKARKRA